MQAQTPTIFLIIIIFIVLISFAFLYLIYAKLSKQDDKKQNIEEKMNQITDEQRCAFRDMRMENAELMKSNRVELAESVNNLSKQIAIQLNIIQTNNDKRLDEMKKTVDENLTEIKNEQRCAFGNMRMENAELMKSNREELSGSFNNLSKQVAIQLNNIQTNNDKRLDEMRKTVDENLTDTLNKRIATSFKTVSDQLESVYKSMGEMSKLSTSLSDNVTDLSRVLTNVKTRGTWAEVQLENIFDQMIPGRYDKNVSTNNNSQRVEFAIKIPSENAKNGFLYLPVDSKFPVEAYTRIQNAADEGDESLLASAKKELRDTVKKQAQQISKYINEPTTTPFAIMYLATEGLYAEIASDKENILDRIQREYHIIVAGPSNIMALLSAFQMGFKTIAINDKMKDIREILSQALKQYDMFADDIEKAQKSLDAASAKINQVAKRNGIMYRKIKKIDSVEIQDEIDDEIDDIKLLDY
ncbi:MAG: DNA recombination protein RmuC [Clostridia bacterium]|nr:DNA recombination protein RmuC [Clostridia bacterium]